MRKTFKILFLILAIALAIGINRTSYSYFASSVSGSQDAIDTQLNVGTWIFAEEWIATKMYQKNDIVKHNGIKYTAIKPNMNKEPGMPGSKKFWSPL